VHERRLVYVRLGWIKVLYVRVVIYLFDYLFNTFIRMGYIRFG
jgi:hypothetical protein